MTSFRPSPGSSRPTSVGSKIGVSFFFLFFMGIGCAFVFLVAREAVAGLKTWTWSVTNCEIVQSNVLEPDPHGRRRGDYSPDIEYRYTYSGQTFNSSRHTLKPVRYADYGKAARLAEAYPPGSHAVCYVNPTNPSEAVLQRGSLLFPLLVLFPMIFVVIGGVGIYSAWRPPKTRPEVVRPISDRASGVLGQGAAILFFSIFMLLGLVLCFAFSIHPLSLVLAARSWAKVPCTILSSEVRSHSGNHGSTYSVNILYSYTLNDREYKANRYDFMGGSSSGFSSKQAIVSRFPTGSRTFCYVDPSAPSQAVLQPGFTPLMCIGLLPLIFFLLGLTGVVSTIRKKRANISFKGAYYPNSAVEASQDAFTGANASDSTATLALQRGSSPRSKFFATVVIALFWNGIVSVFVVQIFKHWRSNSFEWFLALFMTPFALIGVILIAAIGYFFLALFNPRPHLTVTPGSPRLGDSLKVEWTLSGRVESLRNLGLRLEGREEATYTRGTRSATDRNVFARLEIASATMTQEMRSGSGSVIIPADLMHTFVARHNKIIWSIRIEGQIPRWPDLAEEFALTVLPAARTPRENL